MSKPERRCDCGRKPYYTYEEATVGGRKDCTLCESCYVGELESIAEDKQDLVKLYEEAKAELTIAKEALIIIVVGAESGKAKRVAIECLREIEAKSEGDHHCWFDPDNHDHCGGCGKNFGEKEPCKTCKGSGEVIWGGGDMFEVEEKDLYKEPCPDCNPTQSYYHNGEWRRQKQD